MFLLSPAALGLQFLFRIHLEEDSHSELTARLIHAKHVFFLFLMELGCLWGLVEWTGPSWFRGVGPHKIGERKCYRRLIVEVYESHKVAKKEFRKVV